MSCRAPRDTPWCDYVLDRGYKVLLLDQRGTGLSSTITASSLAALSGDKVRAAYLKLFRADSIVSDCEAVRRLLTADFPDGEGQKWSVCGQSFGGFCCVNYLSRFPEALREVFTIGGLPPLVEGPDEVYRKLLGKVYERNMAYYRKYEEDVERVKDIARYLGEATVVLPSGGRLSVLRLRQLGMSFGFHSGLDEIHELILRMANDLGQVGFIRHPTLAIYEAFSPFDEALLYAMVHEPLYARGRAPCWSADRMMKQDPRFSKVSLDGPDPILFTGEMIFRDMFDDIGELVSLKSTADLLAFDSDWPELYDEVQLAKNEVPVYSITYIHDMYVHFDLAMDTASNIRGCKNFVTNMLYHNAMGSKSEEVMRHLFALREDTID